MRRLFLMMVLCPIAAVAGPFDGQSPPGYGYDQAWDAKITQSRIPGAIDSATGYATEQYGVLTFTPGENYHKAKCSATIGGDIEYRSQRGTTEYHETIKLDPTLTGPTTIEFGHIPNTVDGYYDLTNYRGYQFSVSIRCSARPAGTY